MPIPNASVDPWESVLLMKIYPTEELGIKVHAKEKRYAPCMMMNFVGSVLCKMNAFVNIKRWKEGVYGGYRNLICLLLLCSSSPWPSSFRNRVRWNMCLVSRPNERKGNRVLPWIFLTFSFCWTLKCLKMPQGTPKTRAAIKLAFRFSKNCISSGRSRQFCLSQFRAWVKFFGPYCFWGSGRTGIFKSRFGMHGEFFILGHFSDFAFTPIPVLMDCEKCVSLVEIITYRPPWAPWTSSHLGSLSMLFPVLVIFSPKERWDDGTHAMPTCAGIWGSEGLFSEP